MATYIFGSTHAMLIQVIKRLSTLSITRSRLYTGVYTPIMLKKAIYIKSGNLGHQVNSDIHLQIVEIQMRRLLMSKSHQDFHCLLG